MFPGSDDSWAPGATVRGSRTREDSHIVGSTARRVSSAGRLSTPRPPQESSLHHSTSHLWRTGYINFSYGLSFRRHLVHIAIHIAIHRVLRGTTRDRSLPSSGVFLSSPQGLATAAGSFRRLPNARECLDTSPVLISRSGS